MSTTEFLPEGVETPPAGWRAMAVVRWTLVAMMALAAFGSLSWWMGWFDETHEHAESAVYTCPMHPAVIQDGPGSCPICGMDLVPKEKTAPVEPGANGVPGLVPVEVDAERTQLIGMRTAKVTRETFTPDLRTVGTVVPNENGLAMVQTRFAGWIEALDVAETGRRVKKGEVLARIYSPELLAAQEEWLNALKWAGGGGASASLAPDARRRLELLGLGATELDAIQRSGEPLRAVPIRAPSAGHVVEKNATVGEYVQPGTTLFSLADLSTVWVIADVYETEMASVTVGQKGSFTPAAYPGERFAETVDFVYPVVDAETRTLRARIRFANAELRLKPGMYGDVELALPAVATLVVPSEALVDNGELQYVFLALPGGKFEPRRVRAGTRHDDAVAILDGLAEGDVVVTSANFLIDSESRLQGAIHGHANH